MEKIPEEKFKIKLCFPELTAAQANKNAQLLEQEIYKESSQDISIETIKENPSTQDGGATLVIVIGISATNLLARGIKRFLEKSGDRVTIKTPEGDQIEAIGTAATQIDIEKVIKEIKRKK